MLSRRLEKKGFDVLLADGGREGVELAQRESPDLILMDMRLPDLDGWSATRQLKADPATQPDPRHRADRPRLRPRPRRALAAGCDDFDTKPVELEPAAGEDRDADRAVGDALTAPQPRRGGRM